MSDETHRLRVHEGWTEAPRPGHGTEIAFAALPDAWAEGDEVDVLFPGGERVHLYAEPEPEHGPATFAWVRAPHQTWLVRLKPLRVNVLVMCLDEAHRGIIESGH